MSKKIRYIFFVVSILYSTNSRAQDTLVAYSRISDTKLSFIIEKQSCNKVLFYAEYNLRLFLILMSRQWDIVYACDADK